MKVALESATRQQLQSFLQQLELVRRDKRQSNAFESIERYISITTALLAGKADWIDLWVEIGRNNQWIAGAFNPPFSRESFYECTDPQEMWDLISPGWYLGRAFFWGDICLINQKDYGDDWVVIKQLDVFDHWAVRDLGRDKFVYFLQKVKHQTIKEYWSVGSQFGMAR